LALHCAVAPATQPETASAAAAAGPDLVFDEAAARRVLMVQAFESGTEGGPLWTPEDRLWATRLARETTPAGAPAERFLDERARHALQRLQPRSAAVARTLGARLWRPGWLVAALLIGLGAGVAVDAIGSSQQINLLAPPVWAVIAWNLAVYVLLVLALLLPLRAPRGLRGWLARRLARWRGGDAALLGFGAAWARHGAPLLAARAALLLHAAAAALALGLIAGLYVRGLVLDYRAGWQSTFLESGQVSDVLATLLAPATAVTGIAVPDAAALQALRFGPEAAPTAPAAPWIHLYAAMLGLFVVLPRTLLMALAAWQAHRYARHLPLQRGELYFQRLLREQAGALARVQVLPQGAPPTAAALAGLRALLAAGLGPGLQLDLAAATAYGDEDSAAALVPPAGTSLRLLLVDLGATPENDTHGRFAQALRAGAPALPLLLLADEAAFLARFASLPARVAERRTAWQRWAAAQQLDLLCADLRHPDLAAAEPALQQLMAV
jgi:hypothetical protein